MSSAVIFTNFVTVSADVQHTGKKRKVSTESRLNEDAICERFKHF